MLSDLRFAKAFSFHNRSSSNFAYTYAHTHRDGFSAAARPCRSTGHAAACGGRHLATRNYLWPSPGHDSYAWLFLFRHCWLYALQIFAFLVFLCLLCTICAGLWENWYGAEFQQILPWETFIPGSYAGDGGADESKTGGGAAIIGIMTFFSYIIVLNTLVPISLYVRWVCLTGAPARTLQSAHRRLNLNLSSKIAKSHRFLKHQRPERRLRSLVNFRGKTFLPENISHMYEKLTECRNYIWYLPE